MRPTPSSDPSGDGMGLGRATTGGVPSGPAQLPIGAVTLTVPSHPSMARVARLTAGALAAVADTSLDELDDIKLLVSEMMGLLTEHGAGGEIALRFTLGDGGIALAGSTPCAAAPPLDFTNDRFQLCRTVLATASSNYDLSHTDDTLRVAVHRRLDPREA